MPTSVEVRTSHKNGLEILTDPASIHYRRIAPRFSTHQARRRLDRPVEYLFRSAAIGFHIHYDLITLRVPAGLPGARTVVGARDPKSGRSVRRELQALAWPPRQRNRFSFRPIDIPFR